MKVEWSTVVIFGIVVAAGVTGAIFKLWTPETAIAMIGGNGLGSLLKPALNKDLDKTE